jgi:DNA-binding transcriptional LysR family regulator
MDEKTINFGFSRALPRKRAREFNVEEIFHDRLWVALPLSHPLAAKKVVDLQRLAGEAFVEFHRQGAPLVYDEVMATCRRAGFSPHVIHEPDIMNSVLLLVESGLGVSLVPSNVRNASHPRVALRPIKPASARMPLIAFWPKSADAPILDAFLGVLREAKAEIRKKMETD